MTDRELDYRIGAEATIRVYGRKARKAINDVRADGCPEEIALVEAVGDLFSGRSRGHYDLSHEWALIAAIATEALASSVASEARRPVEECDLTNKDFGV